MRERPRISTPVAVLLLAALFLLCNCKNYSQNKLKRDMKPLAEKYLQEENITGYKDLTIECVDTVTEIGYAQMTLEMLRGMEYTYENDYHHVTDEKESDALYHILLDIERITNESEELLESGSLSSEKILLYMVTSSYQTSENLKKTFYFMVNPDKKSLHTVDPFGENLILQ